MVSLVRHYEMGVGSGLHRLAALVSAAIVGGGLVVPLEARACPDLSGGGGTDYSGLFCDNGGSAICQPSGSVWECELTRNGGTDPAEAWAVYAAVAGTGLCDTGSDEDYCVWGTDTSNSKFCCRIEGASINLDEVRILGGDSADEIWLYYTDDELDAWGTTVAVDGYVTTRDGDDTIHGSPSNNTAWYTDKLYGGPDDDTIYGFEGEDQIFGEDGEDTLYGGDDDDELYGGNDIDTIDGQGESDTIQGDGGDDILRGGEGADTIYGGSGNDQIRGDDGRDMLYGDGGDDGLSGNADDDTLNGGNDDDALCGDMHEVSGGDTLIGGPGDDQLWGATAGDSNDGGGHIIGDACDSVSSNANCESVQSGSPSCP